jgi:RES domain-containing protein
MPTPTPEFDRLFTTMKSLSLASSWSGQVFRMTLPRWVSKPYRLTGVGSLIAGGRWNVQSLMTAVYFSGDDLTVAAEADAKARRFGWNTSSLKPQTRFAANLQLNQILDLTAPSTLKALKLTKKTLTDCDWEADKVKGVEALTQAVARAAFELMLEAIVAPSARNPSGKNIIVFPSNLQKESVVDVIQADQIPFMHGLG